MSCCEGFIALIGFCVQLGLEVGDLVGDWDFYVEVKKATQPDVNKLNIPILIFDILGSATFVLQASPLSGIFVTTRNTQHSPHSCQAYPHGARMFHR